MNQGMDLEQAHEAALDAEEMVRKARAAVKETQAARTEAFRRYKAQGGDLGQLAREIGVSRATISFILKGER